MGLNVLLLEEAVSVWVICFMYLLLGVMCHVRGLISLAFNSWLELARPTQAVKL